MESQYYIYITIFIVIIILFLLKKRKPQNKRPRYSDSKSIIEQLNIEINLNPKDEAAYYRRGKAKLKINDRNGAYKDFCTARDLGYEKANEIIENRLSDLEERNRLSNFDGYIESLPYIDKQKALTYKNEFEDYTKMINANPKNHTAYLMRAGIKELIKDYSGAINDLNKAIIIKRDFADAIAKRGIVKLKMDDKENAFKDLELAEKLGSNQAKTMLKKYFGE
jgi:tetratricopeptide (TPR) repeat protein